MNIREISDVFKDTASGITALKSYNFGWASDRVRQGNTEDFQELNEFPRVFFSVPTIPASDQTKKQDTYQVTLFFDDLLGYDNEGDEDPTLQIDKWANLQQYANYFIQRLNKIKQSILPNYLFIPEAPSITFDSFTGIQRMITVQLSFNLVVPTNCDPGVITLVQCIANIVTSSNLTASLKSIIKFAASLEGRATLTADIALVQKVASSLNAFGTLTGDITFVKNMQAALNGTAALSGGINFVQKPEASLNAFGTLVSDLKIAKTFESSLNANGTLVSDATIAKNLASSLTSSNSLAASALVSKLASASLTGAGTTAANLTVTSSAPLLLDTYPNAAAAYSLRKLRTAYTGSAIRVRRSSDNTEQDIGFVSDQLDTVSLLAFCGAGNGFVTTWYDQSNNARNATQTVQASQPQVVSSGTIINVNNKPSLLGNGSYFLQVLSSTSAFNFIHNGTLSTILSVQKSNSISVENRFYGNNAANSNNVGFSLRQNIQVITNQISRGVFATNSVVNSSGNILTINQCLLTLIIDADNATASQRSKMYLNQGSEIINNANLQLPSVNDASLNLHLFTDGGSPRLSGNIQEFVVYDTDQSINRVAIQTNINTHYVIY